MTPRKPKGYVSPSAWMYAPRPEWCTVDGCPRPAETGDYCNAHWARVRRTGSPGPAEVRPYRRREVTS